MRISSLSLVDYANLVGHYSRLQHGNTIDPRLLERFKDQPERLAEIQKQVAKKGGRVVKALNVVFKNPIESYVFDNFGYVYTLFKKYSGFGVLPFTGSLADQPAQIIEIFNTLEALDSEAQEKAQREAEAKSKRKTKR